MNLSKYLTLLISTLISFGVYADTSIILTEANIKETLESFDSSIPEKNINSIHDYLANNVKITLEFQTDQGIQILKLNKNQYINLTLDAWSKINPSIPNRKILNIQIDKKSNKATVESITTEIVEMEGKKITNQSKELLTFKANKGTIKLVESYSQVGSNK